MELIYNNVSLHGLGAVLVRSQQIDPDGSADAPTGRRVTLRVALAIERDTFHGNRDMVDAARAALETPRARLTLRESPGVGVVVDREVSVGPVNWPDTGQGMTRYQELELSFSWTEGEPGEVRYTEVTFTKTGDTAPGDTISLGDATEWKDRYTSNALHALRNIRSDAPGQVSLQGEWLADETQPLATRREALLAKRAAWLAKLNGESGTLVFGGFSQLVRVESFDAQVNAAATKLRWSLAGSYSQWPDRAAYLIVDYTLTEREDASQGNRRVTLTGRIGAQTAAAARAKLAELESAAAARYSGKTLHADGEPETTERLIGNDTDDEEHAAASTSGEFVELSFTKHWRVSTSASVQGWSLRLESSEDTRQNRVRHTWRGHVDARGATWGDAYQAAHAKALTLGGNKQAVLLGGRITANDDQQSADYAGSSSTRYCRVEFTWEYQVTSDRVWVDLRSELQKDSAGAWIENVRGEITAATFAMAKGYFDTLKGSFVNMVILQETIGEHRTRTKTTRAVGGAHPNKGAAYTPAGSSTWGAQVNTTEVADSFEPVTPTGITPLPQLTGMEEEFIHTVEGFSFSWQILRQRDANQVSVRYERDTHTDHRQQIVTVTLQGSIGARTRAELDTTVTGLTPLGATIQEQRLTEERAVFMGDPAAAGDNVPFGSDVGALGHLLTARFTLRYQTRLTGSTAILQAEASEDLSPSGPHLVVHPTAFGRPVVQQCGWEEGSRTLRVSAVSASEQAAEQWVRAQWRMKLAVITTLYNSGGTAIALDTSTASPNSTNRWKRMAADGTTVLGYLKAPRFQKRMTWLPLQSSPAARATENVQVWQVSLEVQEILPTADAAPEEWFS